MYQNVWKPANSRQFEEIQDYNYIPKINTLKTQNISQNRKTKSSFDQLSGLKHLRSFYTYSQITSIKKEQWICLLNEWERLTLKHSQYFWNPTKHSYVHVYLWTTKRSQKYRQNHEIETMMLRWILKMLIKCSENSCRISSVIFFLKVNKQECLKGNER